MIARVLRSQFVFRPFLLSSVSKPFSGLEHAYKLYELAGEYLPEEREKLFDLTPTDAARRFIRSFSARYFPLTINENAYDYTHRSLAERLAGSIPLKFLGMNRWDYERFHTKMPMSQFLAETICVCPFQGHDDRLAVVEEFKTILKGAARPLLELLPEKGFELADVAGALEGSPYPGLLARARWVFHQTGCRWLDKVDEEFGRDQILWSRGNVTRLSKDWQKYLELDKQMKSFESWLGHDTAARCGEVIRYIAEKIKNKPKTLMEVFSGDENGRQKTLKEI